MRIVIAVMVSALTLFALSVAAQKAAQSATQFYMQYRDVWQQAKSIEPILPYLGKDSRAEIEATPKVKRQDMFEMMKMMGNLSNVKVVSESKQGNSYLLELTATSPEKKAMKGAAEIIMEDGAMKLRKETWTS